MRTYILSFALNKYPIVDQFEKSLRVYMHFSLDRELLISAPSGICLVFALEYVCMCNASRLFVFRVYACIHRGQVCPLPYVRRLSLEYCKRIACASDWFKHQTAAIPAYCMFTRMLLRGWAIERALNCVPVNPWAMLTVRLSRVVGCLALPPTHFKWKSHISIYIYVYMEQLSSVVFGFARRSVCALGNNKSPHLFIGSSGIFIMILLVGFANVAWNIARLFVCAMLVYM